MTKKKGKQKQRGAQGQAPEQRPEAAAGPPPKMKRKECEREMRVLHGELVAMQERVKSTGAKICIVFEAATPPGRGA